VEKHKITKRGELERELPFFFLSFTGHY